MVTFAQAVGGKARIVGGPFGSKLTQKDYREIGVPVIRGANMSGKGRWIEGPFAYVSEEKFRTDLTPSAANRGDIVVTQRGTLGQVAIIADDAPHLTYVVSQSQMAIDVDRRVADRDFVYYFLTSPTFRQFIEVSAIQTGVPHINLGLLRDVEVNWPAREEQRRIASILGALDDKIEVNRRMNETLEAMARAIFQDWFVAFGPTRAKMEGRPPYLAPDLWSLFPARLDAQGKPEGWQAGTLLDLCELKRGYDLPAARRVPGAVPIVSSSGITDHHDTAMVDAPGVITGRYGTIGEVFFLEKPYWPLNTALYVRDFRGHSPRFVFYTLRLLDFSQYSDKGAVPGVNRNDLHRAPVMLPPVAVQEAFDRILSPGWARIAANDRECASLAATRDLLLPRLMSGELRVRDAERLVETAA